MIPYLLAIVGGYLIGQSRKESFAKGGETTGEYAIRVYGNDQETDSVMSWVYDVEADSEDEAIRKAEDMFNYEWGLSGIDFIKAKVVRMEEIPVYEDGGQPRLNYKGLKVEIRPASATSSKLIIWDIKSGQKFANEKFDSIEEAKHFVDTNKMVLVAKPAPEEDEDGGQPAKFTFKTDEEYDSKVAKTPFFEYETVDIEAIKFFGQVGQTMYYFQPKSLEQYNAIKDSGLYKIVSEKPLTAYYDKSEYEDRDDDYYEDDRDNDYDDRYDFLAKGGKVKFRDKVEAIADRLEGTKVPARLRKDYGGRYNRQEAEEAGKRIAGAQLKKDGEKSNKKNTFVSANARENQSVKLKPNTMSTSKKGEKIKLISAHAKKIWNKEKGEKWKDAIKRASAELKKQNKI